jgi:hypothetical protein
LPEPDAGVVALRDQVGGGVVERQVDRHFRMAGAKPRNQRLHYQRAKRPRHGEAQVTCRFVAEQGERGKGVVDLARCSRQRTVQRSVGLGQRHIPGIARKKNHAVLALHHLDRLAGRRGRHVEA